MRTDTHDGSRRLRSPSALENAERGDYLPAASPSSSPAATEINVPASPLPATRLRAG